MDSNGSAIPAIVAGMARLLIVLKFIIVFKKNCFTILIPNNERDIRYFDKCLPYPLFAQASVTLRMSGISNIFANRIMHG
jgi:hypothetical protein